MTAIAPAPVRLPLLRAGAVGMRHTVAGRLVAGLLTVRGLGLIVAGIFRMDPVDGFPISR